MIVIYKVKTCNPLTCCLPLGPLHNRSCGGGGFSDVFTTPSWQQAEVTAYLAAAKAAGVLPSKSPQLPVS